MRVPFVREGTIKLCSFTLSARGKPKPGSEQGSWIQGSQSTGKNHDERSKFWRPSHKLRHEGSEAEHLEVPGFSRKRPGGNPKSSSTTAMTALRLNLSKSPKPRHLRTWASAALGATQSLRQNCQPLPVEAQRRHGAVASEEGLVGRPWGGCVAFS